MSSNGTATPTSDQPSPPPATTPTQPGSSPSLTEPSTTVTSPAPPPPTSTPVDVPSSPPSPPPSTPDAEPTEEPSEEPTSERSTTSAPPGTTQTRTASTRPPSTQVITSVVTPSPNADGQTEAASTIVVTSTSPGETVVFPTDAPSSSAAPTESDAASLQSPGAGKPQGGLSTGGKTAIAVVVPVVVVALLVIAGILLWRRRKSKKNDAEARRKEVEEYGFNPNNDPTLPAVGMTSEMTEDQSGYRGWGNTTASSHAKGSTTLASGNTYSDSNSNPGGNASPGSPTHGAYSDGHSGDPLVHNRRETLDSDGIGALGAAPVAQNNQGGVHRGPSNASSSYSAADRSDNSGDYPIPVNNPQEYYDNTNNGYYHAQSPYDNNAYAGQQQPIIRDVSARRNTRIESPSVFPQQGNSGIAQNF